VLVVEDEPNIRELVCLHLGLEGYTCDALGDGLDALGRTERDRFDLLVLDVMVPGLDGLALCRAVRNGKLNRDVPILMLTARREESDKVVGLESGADDYLTKPFGVAELVARIRALLRRVDPASRRHGPVRWADVAVDLEAREVEKAGKRVHLTPIEFALVAALLRKPGAVWTHRQLMAAVWGTTAGVTTDTLRVHMGGLRRKLEDDPQQPRWFRTEPWVGYRFTPES
jgi:DNA-binding response OmpR family regulator